MNDLEEIIDNGSVIHFPNYGQITIQDFYNNGTNSKIHKCDHDQYAVKIHRPKKLNSRELDISFTSETDIPFSGNFLCTPLDSIVINLQNDRACLVLLMDELFEFMMLRDFLKQPKTCTIFDKVSIVKSILEGLSQIHSSGWIHGDLSDRNIMINPNTFEIKFIDFEWSLDVNHIKESNDIVKGTLEMVSPEVRHYGSKAQSTESEIWAICKLILQIFDPGISKQFREIDEKGLITYITEIGSELPIYKANTKIPQLQEFISLLETGTCTNVDLRPSLTQLLDCLGNLSLDSAKDITLVIEESSGEDIILEDGAIGIELELNNGQKYMLRQGKEKTITLGEDLFMIIDYTKNVPNLIIEHKSLKKSLPLKKNIEFGINLPMYKITKINTL